jgi:hypothetical protein
MIPQFIKIDILPWQILPSGIHVTTMEEVKDRFANNMKRRMLFTGLEKGIAAFAKAGCSQIFLDGSYVTSKSDPNDYDVCWDEIGVQEEILDPIFFIFDNKREAQKNKYLGEYFPMNSPATSAGIKFIDFFQIEKHTGLPKGILNIKLRG